MRSAAGSPLTWTRDTATKTGGTGRSATAVRSPGTRSTAPAPPATTGAVASALAMTTSCPSPATRPRSGEPHGHGKLTGSARQNWTAYANGASFRRRWMSRAPAPRNARNWTRELDRFTPQGARAGATSTDPAPDSTTPRCSGWSGGARWTDSGCLDGAHGFGGGLSADGGVGPLLTLVPGGGRRPHGDHERGEQKEAEQGQGRPDHVFV